MALLSALFREVVFVNHFDSVLFLFLLFGGRVLERGDVYLSERSLTQLLIHLNNINQAAPTTGHPLDLGLLLLITVPALRILRRICCVAGGYHQIIRRSYKLL